MTININEARRLTAWINEIEDARKRNPGAAWDALELFREQFRRRVDHARESGELTANERGILMVAASGLYGELWRRTAQRIRATSHNPEVCNAYRVAGVEVLASQCHELVRILTRDEIEDAPISDGEQLQLEIEDLIQAVSTAIRVAAYDEGPSVRDVVFMAGLQPDRVRRAQQRAGVDSIAIGAGDELVIDPSAGDA